MYTPYDWQESIGNRASYIEGKLSQGAPAMAVSLNAGILVFTYRRQAQKIYEIYDRLIFAAIGQQSDIEALRTASVVNPSARATPGYVSFAADRM